MRSARSSLLVLVVLALLLAACRGAAATPTDAASAAADTPRMTPTTAPSEPVSRPGQPYTAAALLAAMRDSRRPGGVPDELETDAVAAALAEAIWTWDGATWETISVGGSCGPASCSLDVAGAPAGSSGVDLYSFAVDPDAEQVSLAEADLHGYPTGLEPELDAVARMGIEPGRLEGLELLAASWLPPPDAGRYRLAYRSGGEEGSPGLDVLVDLPSGTVLSVEEAG